MGLKIWRVLGLQIPNFLKRRTVVFSFQVTEIQMKNCNQFKNNRPIEYY